MEEFQNPYSSPMHADPSAPPRDVKPAVAQGKFKSGRMVAYVTIFLLALNGLIDTVSAGSSYLQIDLIQRSLDGAVITEEEAAANDSRETLIGFTQIGIYLVTVVFFLSWFHRAYSNLPALGAHKLTYSPGWAIGGWFVPILNLVRPCQVAQEIWRFSDPQGVSTPMYRTSNSTLVGFWWGFWILGNIAGQISLRLSLDADSAEDFLAASWVALGGCLIGIPLAALAVAVVYKINQNQEERYWRVSGGSADVGFPAASSPYT